ncbi:MAG: amidohydrolase [Candidatus Sumerlaeota bacterium]|nr:amidohydrolase [Candidatus Sumerlaeota bacterium]
MRVKSRIYSGIIVFTLLILGTVAAQESSSVSRTYADTVILNGKIITVDAHDSIAQAVAVKGDKIIKVGTNEAIRPLIGPNTKTLDLKGRTATPGLIDSHIHVMYYGRQFWPGYLNIRFPDVKSKANLLRLLGQKANQMPKGEWISGNQGFQLQPGEVLTRADLDNAAPLNPVYVRHSSGQFAVVNSAALKLAGINKNTPDPYGGKIVRDPATHEPTGVLLHYPAENLIGKYAKGYGDRTESELIEDIKRGQDICLSAGYTSGQDVIVALPRDIATYKKLAESNQLKMRIYLMLYVNSEDQADQYARMIKPFKTDMLTFGGWKLALDGGIAPGTTLMYDKNLFASKHAYYYHDPETLKRIVKTLHNTGLQVAFHVVGDQAIDEALDAIEAALKESPRENHRHRLEHVLFPTRAALERTKKLGVVLSMQPQWISWFGAGIKQATDEDTMKRFMPLGTIEQMGIPIAFGCDVPASLSHDPKWAFWGAITRRSKNGYIPYHQECLSIKHVLRIHTMGSAYAAFEEKIKGSIEEGKLADIVVWSHDFYSMFPRELNDLKAEMTMVGGKIVYGKVE